jgi:hypothetical protein
MERRTSVCFEPDHLDRQIIAQHNFAVAAHVEHSKVDDCPAPLAQALLDVSDGPCLVGAIPQQFADLPLGSVHVLSGADQCRFGLDLLLLNRWQGGSSCSLCGDTDIVG